ncbi:MAG: hypothetical protein ACERKZ_20305 [Lachnotalea sp.]
MKAYELISISGSGYERIGYIKDSITNTTYYVHFLEYDEYIEAEQLIRKRNKGELLIGNLRIDLVTGEHEVKEPLFFRQPISDSNHVEAIVEVREIIDNFSMYAFVDIIDDIIEIEFENSVDYECGSRIKLIGSLELDLEED